MFEGSKPHFFEFCHRLEVTGETPDKIALSFTQFGLSNGSDEDQLADRRTLQPSAAPRKSRAAARRMRLR